MDNKKLISINLDVLKDKAASAANAARAKAKTHGDKAVASLLGKGIALSKKQLDALEKARKAFA